MMYASAEVESVGSGAVARGLNRVSSTPLMMIQPATFAKDLIRRGLSFRGEVRIAWTGHHYHLEVDGDEVDGMIWSLEEDAWAEPDEVAAAIGPLLRTGASVTFFGVCFDEDASYSGHVAVQRSPSGETYVDMERRRFESGEGRPVSIVMSTSNRPRCSVVDLAIAHGDTSVVALKHGA